jgi:hypothetical protein
VRPGVRELELPAVSMSNSLLTPAAVAITTLRPLALDVVNLAVAVPDASVVTDDGSTLASVSGDWFTCRPIWTSLTPYLSGPLVPLAVMVRRAVSPGPGLGGSAAISIDVGATLGGGGAAGAWPTGLPELSGGCRTPPVVSVLPGAPPLLPLPGTVPMEALGEGRGEGCARLDPVGDGAGWGGGV